MTDTASVTVTPEPAPGPGMRLSRSSGQIGAVVVFVGLWQAFGWMGADTWTAEQAGLRWPAITAAGYWLASAGQNVWNWWQTRGRAAAVPGAVTVEAVPAPKRRARGEAGHGTHDLVLVIATVWLAVIFTAWAFRSGPFS